MGRKLKMGFVIEKVQSVLRRNGFTETADLWEVSNPKKPAEKKRFISEEAAIAFLSKKEAELVQKKALAGQGAPGAAKTATIKAERELKAFLDIAEDESPEAFGMGIADGEL